MKSILWIVGLLIAAAAGWYEFSPLYTLSQMRTAAEAGNAAELSDYVDYQALKIDMKGDLRREILLETNRRGAARDPLTHIGADFAVALVQPAVDLLVTPETVQAMFDGRSAANQARRGAAPAASSRVGVMPVEIPKTDAVIERHGLSEFKVKKKGKEGAAIFQRYGWRWKLAGIDMPDRFGRAKK